MAGAMSADNALVPGAMGLACDGFDHRLRSPKPWLEFVMRILGVDDRGNREWCPELGFIEERPPVLPVAPDLCPRGESRKGLLPDRLALGGSVISCTGNWGRRRRC